MRFRDRCDSICTFVSVKLNTHTSAYVSIRQRTAAYVSSVYHRHSVPRKKKLPTMMLTTTTCCSQRSKVVTVPSSRRFHRDMRMMSVMMSGTTQMMVGSTLPSILPSDLMLFTFNVNPVMMEENPLTWWKQHGHLFPTLLRFARRYLEIRKVT
jgi:hypothetical protein